MIQLTKPQTLSKEQIDNLLSELKTIYIKFKAIDYIQSLDDLIEIKLIRINRTIPITNGIIDISIIVELIDDIDDSDMEIKRIPSISDYCIMNLALYHPNSVNLSRDNYHYLLGKLSDKLSIEIY